MKKTISFAIGATIALGSAEVLADSPYRWGRWDVSNDGLAKDRRQTRVGRTTRTANREIGNEDADTETSRDDGGNILSADTVTDLATIEQVATDQIVAYLATIDEVATDQTSTYQTKTHRNVENFVQKRTGAITIAIGGSGAPIGSGGSGGSSTPSVPEVPDGKWTAYLGYGGG